MNTGDYVRTKYGIAKIEEIKPDKKHNTIWYTVDKAQYHCFLTREQEIIKSSPNIIDLIEVGDYVNGYEVTSKDQFLGFGNHDWYMTNDEIKSIVTREQFESMEYKVGK